MLVDVLMRLLSDEECGDELQLAFPDERDPPASSQARISYVIPSTEECVRAKSRDKALPAPNQLPKPLLLTYTPSKSHGLLEVVSPSPRHVMMPHEAIEEMEAMAQHSGLSYSPPPRLRPSQNVSADADAS